MADPASNEIRVGVDIGGTFTDTVAIDENGNVLRNKVSTTHEHLTDAIVSGLRRLGTDPASLRLFAHGTTIATNAAIARDGAPTALITTEGFRDVLLVRREDREVQYDLWWKPQEPIIDRASIFEVPERLDYQGGVVREFDAVAARKVVEAIKARGKTAIAVCFLHSFVNPDHERRMRDIIREVHPEAYVSVSSEVLPEIMEYERTSTTTLNAYVGPVMSEYFAELRRALSDYGYHDEILISSSAGGMLTPELASQTPARTMVSGPAAGVYAARELAAMSGYHSILTMDMGGTSLDIGMVESGNIQRSNEWIAPFGTPVRFPAIDIQAIGAGGGSIAWIDDAGVLQSGPRSAGSIPGPACYGTGGTKPTNTDAQLVLGRLSARGLLGGEMPLDCDLAARAILDEVGEALGTDDAAVAADAILTISNNNSVQALRLATIYRGYDPRDFAVLAYGGAGPLFSPQIARLADIPTVIVPPLAGLVSAMGLLLMDVLYEQAKAILKPADDLTDDDINAAAASLEEQVRVALSNEGVAAGQVRIVAEVDVRYFGMSHSISVPVEFGPGVVGRVCADFSEVHEREYGYVVPAEVAPIEIANIRVGGLSSSNRSGVKLQPPFHGGTNLADALLEMRSVYFDGSFQDTPIYDRSKLGVGVELDGPAIIEQDDTTTLIHPGMHAIVDAVGALIIDVGLNRGDVDEPTEQAQLLVERKVES